MSDYRSLVVWRKAHALTLAAYRMTKDLPASEAFGLAGQIRRSAASVPANIAEGCGRDSPTELARYLQIAKGSAFELEYHFLLAHDLGFVDDSSFSPLMNDVEEVKRILTVLIRNIRSRPPAKARSRPTRDN